MSRDPNVTFAKAVRVERSARGFVRVWFAAGCSERVLLQMEDDVKDQLREDIAGFEAELDRLEKLALTSARVLWKRRP